MRSRSPRELLAVLVDFHFTALKFIQLLPDGRLHGEGESFLILCSAIHLSPPLPSRVSSDIARRCCTKLSHQAEFNPPHTKGWVQVAGKMVTASLPAFHEEQHSPDQHPAPRIAQEMSLRPRGSADSACLAFTSPWKGQGWGSTAGCRGTGGARWGGRGEAKEQSKSQLTLLCMGTPRFWLLSPHSLLPCQLALALSTAYPLAGRSLERL